MSYGREIVRLNREPLNYGALAEASAEASEENALCGDRLTVYLAERGGIIERITFVSDACAVAKASASLITESLTGREVASVGEPEIPPVIEEFLETNESRRPCALLGWNAARAACASLREVRG